MTHSTKSRLGAAALALAAIGAATAAQAATDLYFNVTAQPQPVYAAPARVVQMAPRQVDEAPPAYAYERRHERERDGRDGCRARPWNPRVRYMPGERVWRQGEMYVATRVSAQVWNVNSPPEWTPNYWRAARCG